jgi:hydrogenase maturation protease
VLVAGGGDAGLGDDRFGIEVARRVARGPLPPGVRVVDLGSPEIRPARELLRGYDVLILIDTVERGGPPGTLYVIESGAAGAEDRPANGTDLSPEAALAMLQALGGELTRVIVVGCEPADAGPGTVLSPPVESAVDEAVRTVRHLLGEVTRTAR